MRHESWPLVLCLLGALILTSCSGNQQNQTGGDIVVGDCGVHAHARSDAARFVVSSARPAARRLSENYAGRTAKCAVLGLSRMVHVIGRV